MSATARIEEDLLVLRGGARLPAGAGAGLIAVSDSVGNISWESASSLPPSGEAATRAELDAEKTRATAQEGLKAARAENLKDLASATTARANLGLGSAAVEAATAFDAKGAAATAQAAAEGAEAAHRAHVATQQYADSISAFQGRINPRKYAGLKRWLHAGRMNESTLAYDNFTRANSSGLGSATTGQAWNAVANTLGISSNHAFCVGEGAAVATATMNIGATSGTVTLIAKVTNEAIIELVGQRSGETFITAEYNTVTKLAKIIRNVAGTPTLLGEVALPALTVGSTFAFVLTCSKNTYTLYKPNLNFEHEVLLEATDSESLAVNNTEYGFGLNKEATAIGFTASTAQPIDKGTVGTWGDLARPDLAQQASQLTAANKPTYQSKGINGLPAVEFNGSTNFMTSKASLGPVPWTQVFVLKPTSFAGTPCVLGATVKGAPSVRIDTTGHIQIVPEEEAEIIKTDQALTVGQTAILVLTYDANGGFVLYVNGRPGSVGIVPHVFTEGELILGADKAGAKPFAGLIAQQLEFSRVLRGSEVRDLTEELAAAYGVTLPERIGRVTTIPVNVAGPVKGINVSPTNANFAHEGGGLTGFWSEWPLAYIEECIAIAQAEGWNVLRVIGSIDSVSNGFITEATYIARLTQLAEKVNAAGMALHYTGGDLRHMTGATGASIQTFMAKCAEALVGKKVFTFEIINEIGTVYNTIPEPRLWDWLRMWAQAIRAALPGVPLTVSQVGRGGGNKENGTDQNTARGADFDRHARLDDIVDFHCVHLYGVVTLHTLDPLLVTSDKPILIGETGIEGNQGTEKIEAFWRTIKELIESDQRIMGVLAWSLMEQNNPVNGDGLYNGTTKLPIPAYVTPYKAIPQGALA